MERQSSNAQLTVADVLARVRRRPLLAGVPLLLGLAGAVGYVLVAPAQYAATASVVVQPLLSDQFGNVNLANVINMATETQVAESAKVAALAAPALGIGVDAVRRSSSVDSPQDTQVLDIHFTAGSAAGAAAGAQTLAESYLAYRELSVTQDADRRLAAVTKQIDDVNKQIALRPAGQVAAYQDSLRSLLADQRTLLSMKSTSGGRVITQAAVPTKRASPQPLVQIPVGMVAGALLGLVLSVLWPQRRTPRPVRVQPGSAASRPAGSPGAASSTGPTGPAPAQASSERRVVTLPVEPAPSSATLVEVTTMRPQAPVSLPPVRAVETGEPTAVVEVVEVAALEQPSATVGTVPRHDDAAPADEPTDPPVQGAPAQPVDEVGTTDPVKAAEEAEAAKMAVLAELLRESGGPDLETHEPTSDEPAQESAAAEQDPVPGPRSVPSPVGAGVAGVPAQSAPSTGAVPSTAAVPATVAGPATTITPNQREGQPVPWYRSQGRGLGSVTGTSTRSRPNT